MVTVAVVAAAWVGACGDGDDGAFDVTSEVLSDPTTQDIQVLAPDDEGTWPIVIAMHGLNGSGEDMVELGTRVAATGAVVFAPTYNTDLSTEQGLVQASEDLVCAYQLALRTAPEHGGDPTQPVTVVGWSLGADFAVLGGLGSGANTSARCPGDVPQPDVVVGLSGCYYEFDGKPVTWFDDLTGWGNKGADLYLVNGDQDAVCPSWQTERLTSALGGAGYDVNAVELADANHYAPVFHDLRDGQWQVISEDPAGEQAVETIVDAIATAGEAD
jgi:predicted esterase